MGPMAGSHYARPHCRRAGSGRGGKLQAGGLAFMCKSVATRLYPGGKSEGAARSTPMQGNVARVVRRDWPRVSQQHGGPAAGARHVQIAPNRVKLLHMLSNRRAGRAARQQWMRVADLPHAAPLRGRSKARAEARAKARAPNDAVVPAAAAVVRNGHEKKAASPVFLNGCAIPARVSGAVLRLGEVVHPRGCATPFGSGPRVCANQVPHRQLPVTLTNVKKNKFNGLKILVLVLLTDSCSRIENL